MPVVANVKDPLKLPPMVRPSLFKPKFRKERKTLLIPRIKTLLSWHKKAADVVGQGEGEEPPHPTRATRLSSPEQQHQSTRFIEQAKPEAGGEEEAEARRDYNRERQREIRGGGERAPSQRPGRKRTGETTEQHQQRLQQGNQELREQVRKATAHRRGWEDEEAFNNNVNKIVEGRIASQKNPKSRAVVEKDVLNSILKNANKSRGFTEDEFDKEVDKRWRKKVEQQFSKPAEEMVKLAETDVKLAETLDDLIKGTEAQVRNEWKVKRPQAKAPKGEDKARSWQGLEPAERVEGEVSPHPEETPIASTDQPNRFVPKTELEEEEPGEPRRTAPFIPPPLKGKPGSKPRHGEALPLPVPRPVGLPGREIPPPDFGEGPKEHGTPFIPQPKRGEPGTKPRHGEAFAPRKPEAPLHEIPGTAQPNPRASSVGYGPGIEPSNQGGNAPYPIPSKREDPLAQEPMEYYGAEGGSPLEQLIPHEEHRGAQRGWAFTIPGKEKPPEIPNKPVDPITGKPLTPEEMAEMGVTPPKMPKKGEGTKETHYIPFGASPKDIPADVQDMLGVDWDKPLGRFGKYAKNEQKAFIDFVSQEGMPNGLVEGPPETNGDVKEGVEYSINKNWGKQVSFSYVLNKTRAEPGKPPVPTMTAREMRETLLGMNPDYPIETLPDVISANRRSVFVPTFGKGKAKRGRATEALVMKMPAGSHERYMEGVARRLGLHTEQPERIQQQLANEDPMLFQYLLRKMGATVEEAAQETERLAGKAKTENLFREYRRRLGLTDRWFSTRAGAGEENAVKKRRMATEQQEHETEEENKERIRRMQAEQAGGMEKRRGQEDVRRRQEEEAAYQQAEEQERSRRQGLQGGL